MALGLQAGYGLKAAYDALRMQRAEAAAANERERAQQEREFQRTLDLRRIAETERSNIAGEGQADRRIAQGDRGLDLETSGQAFTQEGERIKRGYTAEDRARAAEERAIADRLIGETKDNAARRVLALQRVGVNSDRGMFLTPQERGAEKGAESSAAFSGGGRDVASGMAKIEGDQQIRVANARPSASTSPVTPEQAKELDAVAEMVIADPDRLKDFNPTERGKILRHIASSGSGSRIENMRKERASQNQREALEALIALRDMPGMAGAVGAPSLTDPGSWKRFFSDEAAQGSPARAYQEQLKRVTSALTMPRLELMRGTGPLSNADLEMLAKSATSLSTAQDEGAFTGEIKRLEDALARGMKTVSKDQLRQLAQIKGTSYEDQVNRARAEGYIVR